MIVFFLKKISSKEPSNSSKSILSFFEKNSWTNHSWSSTGYWIALAEWLHPSRAPARSWLSVHTGDMDGRPRGCFSTAKAQFLPNVDNRRQERWLKQLETCHPSGNGKLSSMFLALALAVKKLGEWVKGWKLSLSQIN